MAEAEGGGGGGWWRWRVALYPHCILTVSPLYPHCIPPKGGVCGVLRWRKVMGGGGGGGWWWWRMAEAESGGDGGWWRLRAASSLIKIS